MDRHSNHHPPTLPQSQNPTRARRLRGVTLKCLREIPFSLWKSPFKWTLLAAIRLYQSTASIRPRVCRYEPTCSEYMAQGLLKRGLIVGFALGVRRILRCNPYTLGGYDPVPEEPSRTTHSQTEHAHHTRRS